MLMKAAAEKGDLEAQFLMGLQYKVGDGVDKNPAEAAKWLRKAAESGHAEAQYALGEFYADPETGLADPAEAVKWLEAAAKQGNLDAQSRLAGLRAQDLTKLRDRPEENRNQSSPAGTEKSVPADSGAPDQRVARARAMDEDPAETIRWSLLLSGLRGADAYLVRGFLLENGIAVNRDPAAAAASYRKAAEQGDARAQFQLGVMYAEGRGVARDVAESTTWFRRAAANGSADAMARLKTTRPPEPPPEAATKPAQDSSGLPGKK